MINITLHLQSDLSDPRYKPQLPDGLHLGVFLLKVKPASEHQPVYQQHVPGHTNHR